MKKKHPFFLFLLLLIVYSTSSMAGDSTFTDLKGKVYGRIFANYHAQINSDNNVTAFEINRAYFGYRSQLSNYFDANIRLDIGSPEDLSEFSRIRRYAYFRNAYVRYNNNKFSAFFGIIDLCHFKVQETMWGHRYIDKSFNDRYQFGFSADLGFMIEYDWTKWFSFDFSIMNGEGYSKLQTDNTLKAGAGVSVIPCRNFIIRVYYDLSEKSELQSTLASFVGYEIKNKLIAGFEYNLLFNEDYTDNHDRSGYSGYVTYSFFKKFQAFARYDKVYSNLAEDQTYPWNLPKDGSAIIAGIAYEPIKYITIALDYQDWFPSASNTPNAQFIYLNLEVNF